MTKKRYPSAPTYKPKAKGRNNSKKYALKGFDSERLKSKKK